MALWFLEGDYNLFLLQKLIVKIIIYVASITIIVSTYLGFLFIHTPFNVATKEELVINRGATISNIACQLEARNIIKRALLLRGLAWYRGDANQIKAGEYLLEPGITPQAFLQKIVDGRVIQYSFTIIAGWKFSQVLEALHNAVKITKTFTSNNQQEIAKKLDNTNDNYNLEGMLWPDTYFYTAGTNDLELLHRSYKMMQAKLAQVWQERDPNILLKDPKDALILASIIEKEANIKSEYYEISGVFQRRLQKNMLLQADPTVIYALDKAADFKNSVQKIDLSIDSPYNTYKYLGLPPTPIAIPSFAALHAAMHPSAGEALYFVANGRGGHVFSATLAEHNQAVAGYRADRH